MSDNKEDQAKSNVTYTKEARMVLIVSTLDLLFPPKLKDL